jgi:hypothetical protein
MFALLPQSVYPILSRNSFLSSLGGQAYGVLPLGEKGGKVEYAGWAGVSLIASDDGYLIELKDVGINLPNGSINPSVGGSMHWKTPLAGLTVGASDVRYSTSSTNPVTSGTLSGTTVSKPFNKYNTFVRYEHARIMVAGEFTRLPVMSDLTFTNGPTIPGHKDDRGWYGMATYKISDKLSAGFYRSQLINHAAVLGPGRFSKDWTVSARYDFNPFVYAKAEQHFVDGTAIGYDTANNTGGLSPNTRFTILKVGVSF